jgi:hypothetical protein
MKIKKKKTRPFLLYGIGYTSPLPFPLPLLAKKRSLHSIQRKKKDKSGSEIEPNEPTNEGPLSYVLL